MPAPGTPKRATSLTKRDPAQKDKVRNTYLLLRAYYITHEQHDFLRWRAYDKGISQSASIREAIERLMEEEGPAPEPSIKKPRPKPRASQKKKEGNARGDES
jgi:hypothetical protein